MISITAVAPGATSVAVDVADDAVATVGRTWSRRTAVPSGSRALPVSQRISIHQFFREINPAAGSSILIGAEETLDDSNAVPCVSQCR